MIWCKERNSYVADTKCCLCDHRCSNWVGVTPDLLEEVVKATGLMLEIRLLFRRRFDKYLLVSSGRLSFADEISGDCDYVFETCYLFSVRFSFRERLSDSDGDFCLKASSGKFCKGKFFIALYYNTVPVAVFSKINITKLIDSKITHVVSADLIR